MKVLVLGPLREKFVDFLEKNSDEVIRTDHPVTKESSVLKKVDFVISYGFRHIIPKEVIDLFPGKIINFHISYLPWNRGADPNLWSFLEDTPKGVTIHQVAPELDTGHILLQKKVRYFPDDTLRTMYDRLTKEIEMLFTDNWGRLRTGEVKPIPQVGAGSYHKLSDREKYKHLLGKEWDTPVVELVGKAGAKSLVTTRRA